MNFERLFADQPHREVRYTLTGAKGGFARTLLAQTRSMPRLVPAALCDLDVPGLQALCEELGFPAARLHACRDAAAVAAAPADAIVLVADAGLLRLVPGCCGWCRTTSWSKRRATRAWATAWPARPSRPVATWRW